MIKEALIEDSRIVTELAMLLWQENKIEDLEKELKDYIEKGVIYIYFDENRAAGFAQCSLRQDYVEGTKSSPVGYLEGIFVKEEYRKRGIAKRLLSRCEDWAQRQGCSEFASDCELDNIQSLKFHLKLGFQEANRIICFKKNI